MATEAECVVTGFRAATVTTDLSVPSQPGTVPVMSVFDWIIIHQNFEDNFDWELPWADYRDGFGDINSNFWLGLKRLHLLNSTADEVATCSTLLQLFYATLAQSHETSFF